MSCAIGLSITLAYYALQALSLARDAIAQPVKHRPRAAWRHHIPFIVCNYACYFEGFA
ncbi:protein of unknown function [Pararobbsia alpina]